MFGRGYPTLSYRHGPIAVTQPTTLVTFLTALTPAHERLRAEIDATGAKTVIPEPVKAGDLTYVDPQIELYKAQHLATRIAHALGRDVDAPEGVKAVIDET
jgi:fructoselysine-6-P-deglycase FrlB-like protein